MMVDTRKSARHLSSLHVELLRTGSVAADERAWMEEHLRACGRCSQMAATFESHRLDFANAHPLPASLAQQSAARATPRRAFTRIGLGIVLPAAAAFALFLSVRSPTPAPQRETNVTAKGGAILGLVARREGRVFPVADGAVLKAGDHIRFVIDNVRQRYLLVGSIDGSGQVSIYFPYEGAESGGVTRGQRFEVPGSIALDGSPGPERFFALLSDDPLQTTSVRRALDAVGKKGAAGIRNVSTLDVGANEQASVLVEKATP
jgi:hypothetical protein